MPANRFLRLTSTLMLFVMFAFVALPLGGMHVSAQSAEAGWYYGDDGCLYYWDGYQYTGDYDCSGAGGGSNAGWYYGDDGCLYYWDGYQYTGDYDCS